MIPKPLPIFFVSDPPPPALLSSVLMVLRRLKDETRHDWLPYGRLAVNKYVMVPLKE